MGGAASRPLPIGGQVPLRSNLLIAKGWTYTALCWGQPIRAEMARDTLSAALIALPLAKEGLHDLEPLRVLSIEKNF